MDTARAADASDPDRNYHFRRKWDAPPLKMKRPPTWPKVERAENKVSSSALDVAKIFARFKSIDEPAGEP